MPDRTFRVQDIESRIGQIGGGETVVTRKEAATEFGRCRVARNDDTANHREHLLVTSFHLNTIHQLRQNTMTL